MLCLKPPTPPDIVHSGLMYALNVSHNAVARQNRQLAVHSSQLPMKGAVIRVGCSQHLLLTFLQVKRKWGKYGLIWYWKVCVWRCRRVQLLLTCDVDAGNSVWRQDQVFVTVADDAVLDIIAFPTLTVAAVLHRTYDNLAIPLHACIHMHTCKWREIWIVYRPTLL